MNDSVELSLYIIGFFVSGLLINHVGNSLYWMWVDWKSKRKSS